MTNESENWRDLGGDGVGVECWSRPAVEEAELPVGPGITMTRRRTTSTDALIGRSRVDRGVTLIASSILSSDLLPSPPVASASIDMIRHFMDDEVTTS
jgi:hypothetical protein